MRLTAFPVFTKPLQAVTPQFAGKGLEISKSIRVAGLDNTQETIFNAIPENEDDAVSIKDLLNRFTGSSITSNEITKALLFFLKENYVQKTTDLKGPCYYKTPNPCYYKK